MKNKFITSLSNLYTKNTKSYGIIALVLLIAVGGFFAYKYLYLLPQEEEASKSIALIQYKFGESDTSAAHYNSILKGETSQYRGALSIAKSYPSTKVGNLAKYYAGYCYYAMGQYDKAISYLEDCSIDDDVLQARAYAITADAYAEKKSYIKAADLYIKSFELTDKNLLYGPLYSLRAGILYTLGNDNDKAKNIYKKALSVYPYELENEFSDKMLPTICDQIKKNLSMID